LGRIETSHNGIVADNKGIMKLSVNDGTQLNTLLSLTSNGNIGVGGGTSGQNNPLTLIHATTQSTSDECAMILQSNYNAAMSGDSVFDERSDLYFAGLNSITENLNTDIKYRVLAGISGSNNTNAKDLVGRLDFGVNDNSTVVQNGLESKMCITNTGNVGINILQPLNLLSVCPEQRISTNQKNTISNVVGFQVTLSNNLFSGFTVEQKAMFVGGVVVVEADTLISSTIVSVDSSNQITVANNLAAYIGNTIYVHKAGLNVVKSGFVGVNTITPKSVLSVNGSLSLPILNTTSSITLNVTHYTVIGDTTSGNITITLPINSSDINGRIYVIKNIGGGTLSVDPTSGVKIDNVAATYSVNNAIQLQSDGTDWWILSSY
jgi:hypothetical protein